MTELKTLKDIQFFDETCNNLAKEYNDMVKSELKAEAVKWIRHWRSIDEHCIRCEIKREKACSDLMHFFNITDEELEAQKDE